MGFFDYLVNFLAGDPNYDWTKLFAPSTPAFMEKFKESKAAAIEKARQALQAKIQTEQEALSKKAGEAQTAKGGGDGDGEATATDQQKNWTCYLFYSVQVRLECEPSVIGFAIVLRIIIFLLL